MTRAPVIVHVWSLAGDPGSGNDYPVLAGGGSGGGLAGSERDHSRALRKPVVAAWIRVSA
jgi:hypothetical protein